MFTKDTTKNGEYKGIFGPGHNSFTVDENGNPVIVYHARDWDDSYPGATGENKYGLTDPGRHAYVNSVHFGADGFPIFNMRSEQILAEKLKNVCLTIHVKQGNSSVQPEDNNLVNKVDNQPSAVKQGKIYQIGKNKYRVKSVTKKQVAFVGLKNKKSKSLSIPASVKIAGKKYAVTEIAAKACMNCKKLKRVTIKSKTIKKVGAKAWKGISTKVKIKVPKSKLKVYRKLLKGKGLSKKAKIY